MADPIDLVYRLHYAAYSWGFEAGKVGAHVDTTIAGNKAEATLKELLAALGGNSLANDAEKPKEKPLKSTA